METYQLTIPKALYSKTVLMRTAYRFIDRVYIHFHAKDENWIVEFSEKNSDCIVEIIVKDFENFVETRNKDILLPVRGNL